MSSPSHASAPRRAVALDWLAGAAVAALLLAVYLHSPQRRFFDSKYALLAARALLDHGDFDLSPYLGWLVGGEVAPAQGGADAIDGADAAAGETHEASATPAPRPRLPYQVKESRGRLLYLYSPGTSLLSAPLLPLASVAGYSPLGREGSYDSRRELALQALLAAWLTAGTALLIYRLARRELPPLPSAFVALVAGLGSGLWSAASRVMWTHTWSSLLLAAAWLELVRWEDGERRRGWLVGALMVALFWVRPTGAVFAVAVAVYVFLKHRRALPALLVVGAAGLLAFVLYSLHYWGSLLPRYFVGVGGRLLDERPRAPLVFFELLISPGHGLLVFSPVLLLVFWWLVRHRPAADRRAFALFTLAALFAFVALYSRWGWGGTVGPRFLCDPVALLAWLGAHGWRRARDAGARSPLVRQALGAAAGLALVAASVAAHGGVAWDLRRAGGPPAGARAPAAPDPPYLQRDYWKWRSLPQLELPAILDALEPRRGRGRRGDRPAQAPPDTSR